MNPNQVKMRRTLLAAFALLLFCCTANGQIGSWLRQGAERLVTGGAGAQQTEQNTAGTANGATDTPVAVAQQVVQGPPPRKAGASLELTIEGIKYSFRWCPAGEFIMGSPKDEANRRDNETQHQVTLTRGFWMLETPVTQEMWESVMGKNPSRFQGAKLPVERISWKDCQEFVGGLNDLATPVGLVIPAGLKFAMPTEAQWEYACRAGTTTAYYSGGALNARLANFETRTTSEVGSFPANAWGLRDMHGNVWEWCADGYSGDYSSEPATDPLGVSPRQNAYVVRGGSFYDNSWFSRSASRKDYGPTSRDYHIGFRLALVSTGETVDVVDTPGDQPGQPNRGAAKDISGSVEQFLIDSGWPGEKKEDAASAIYKVVLNDRPYNMIYFVRKNEEQLVVLATLDEKVAESHRAAVNAFLTRINFESLNIGNFQMDLSEGTIHFRVSIDVEHGIINPVIVKQLTFGYAVPTMDKYLPGITEIIGGVAP